ncbi:MAG: response regulator transcription factor [Deltaproteobacteria bacterium]|nr:response regulator transcription factor [Deltaproteobacteria bacterium]
MRVLLVEDTRALAASIARGLTEEGFTVDVARDGEDGLHLATEIAYDAIILDRMLPKLDGLSVLAALRAQGRQTPVLMLTALGEIRDRVEGLDRGADDYVVKPFAFEELLARVRVLVRREHRQSTNVVILGRLKIDSAARSAFLDETRLPLTAKELAVLELLALDAGATYSRTAIAEKIYDEDSDPDSNVIDVFISRLRRKLDAAVPGAASILRTQRGEGYRLDLAELESRP